MNWNRNRGHHYESLAREFLTEKGLVLLRQNYHCRFGEIDLIMLDEELLCFIEVKFRKDLDYGGAIAAITAQKQKKIAKTALYFMTENRKFSQHAMRFDALLMQQQNSDNNLDIDWVQNAYYLE